MQKYIIKFKNFIIRGSRRILECSQFIFKDIKCHEKKYNSLKNQLFYYEAEILNTLNFETSRILTIDLLNCYIIDANISPNSKAFYYCFYMLNLSYLNTNLVSLSKSLLAYSIVYFVVKIFGKGDTWPPLYMNSEFDNKSFVGLNTETTFNLFFNHDYEIKQDFKINSNTRIGDHLIINQHEKPKENKDLNGFSNYWSQPTCGSKKRIFKNSNKVSNVKFDLNKIKSVSTDIFCGIILINSL